jgi:hypothetical protein
MTQRQTQGERILRVLSDGAWHTTSEIHRRAGFSRLNSRVSELRKRGALIECQHLPGRGSGPRAYRYRWTNIPPAVRLRVKEEGPPKVEVPRTLDTRYRIYRVPRFGEQELVDTAPTPEELGVKLVRLAAEGEFANSCIGILDSHGIPKEEEPGTWLVNPHEGRW